MKYLDLHLGRRMKHFDFLSVARDEVFQFFI